MDPPPLTPDDTSPEALKSRYFPDIPSEPAKMAWLKPSPPSTDSSIRFNLSGKILSEEDKSSIPISAGLHHHGTSPDLAGYTLEDVLWLSRSTVPSQRITMLGVLGRILGDYAAGVSNEETQKIIEESAAKQKGVEMAVDILLTRTRAVGIIRAAVEVLYEALGGRTWTWLDEDGPSIYRPDTDPAGLDHVRFDELSPQLKELLGRNTPLPPASTYQLVQILRRALHHSQDTAELITSLVPALVEARVLACPWPINSTAPPSLEVLRMLRETVESSRTCAEIVVNKDILSPLLRFLVPSTWTTDLALGHQLARETLRIFSALARYGLAVSIVTSATDIIRSLGDWVKQHCGTTNSSSEAKSVVIAYCECLTIWTVCAIDPHKTTPDHALTWTQASGLGWVDEAIDLGQAICVQKGRWQELASILAFINAYVAGAKINEPSAGREAISNLTSRLRAAGLGRSMDLLLAGQEQAGEFETRLVEQVLKLENAALDQEDGLFGREMQLRLIEAASFSTASGPVGPAYQAMCLSRRIDAIDDGTWTARSLKLLQLFSPGQETDALDLVDLLLRSDLRATPAVADELASMSHPDKLQILRPLLHYAILPTASQVVGPANPSHLYLKATTTLRRPATQDASMKRQPGLPLSPDWLFTPINELLESSTSPAFSQAPPDWDPSELEIVQATLLLVRTQQHICPTSRSTLLMNLMKVFMLEHNSQATGEHPEAFRDDAVTESLRELVRPMLTPAPYNDDTMEKTAVPFLGPDIPFYQFYSDFVGLYEAISYGDEIFSQLILPPLAMTYPIDFRKLLWVEQPTALHSIRTKLSEAPLEHGHVGAYLSPVEKDADVLAGYTRALIRSWVTPRNETLWKIATWHLAGTFWREGREGKEEVRRGLIRAIMASAPVEVIKEVMSVDLSVAKVYDNAKVGEEKLKGRIEVVKEFGGEQLGEKVRRLMTPS